jgi:hypothetical protein
MNTSRCVVVAALVGALVTAADASAHCDSLDGPVVKAAQRALETGEIAHVLIWVREQDETEIRDAFAQARTVRALGGEAAALADRFFFETLVRVHRAGEGAPYTGLVPAGRDLGPVIDAAEQALRSGSLTALRASITRDIEAGLHTTFEEARATRTFEPRDVRAGRAHVKAYVTFLHYVERLHEAAATAAHHDGPDGSAVSR